MAQQYKFQELYMGFVLEFIRESVKNNIVWGRLTLAPLWDLLKIKIDKINISIFQKEALEVAKHMEKNNMLTAGAKTRWPLFMEMLELKNCSNFRALELYEELRN